MVMGTTHANTFLALADYLIPAHKQMPKFSDVCSWAAALTALDFRIDLKEGFERATGVDLSNGIEAALEQLNTDDSEAFSAVSTIALATYFMTPAVRDLIGYPGQESVTYDPKAIQSYHTDGTLAKVIARGPIYRPTPGL